MQLIAILVTLNKLTIVSFDLRTNNINEMRRQEISVVNVKVGHNLF